MAGVGLLVAECARTVGTEVAAPGAGLGEADSERGTEVGAAVGEVDEVDGEVEGEVEGEGEGVAPPLQAETVNIIAIAATNLPRT
ncbi:MAG: hypothetical protein QOE58_3612 [Actinomycetota bacterium]|nr:hypothetical protein [Actinomycetota bacterium]